MFKKKCKMFPELFEWLMTLCDLGEGVHEKKCKMFPVRVVDDFVTLGNVGGRDLGEG